MDAKNPIKERIIQVSETLFFKQGVRSITMDDVVRELGMSKKTLYQHFEDKESLLGAVAENVILRDKNCFRQIEGSSKNPIDEIKQTTNYLRQLLGQLNPTLMMDLKRYYPKTWHLFEEYINGFATETIERNLQKGIEQGYYRPEIDVKLLAKLRMGEIELAFNTDVFPPENYYLVDVHLKILEHFLFGIFTPKGLKLYKKP